MQALNAQKNLVKCTLQSTVSVSISTTLPRDLNTADRARTAEESAGADGRGGHLVSLPSTRTVFDLPSGSEVIWTVGSAKCGHDATWRLHIGAVSGPRESPVTHKKKESPVTGARPAHQAGPLYH